MVLAFWAGYLFSSHQNHASDSNTSSRASTLFLRRRYGFLDTVSAVSTTSITATSSRTGTSKTFNIISSTVITENHQTISVSKIANGDTVIITSSKTQPNNAIRIIVNPAYDSFRQPVNGSSTTNGSASQ